MTRFVLSRGEKIRSRLSLSQANVPRNRKSITCALSDQQRQIMCFKKHPVMRLGEWSPVLSLSSSLIAFLSWSYINKYTDTCKKCQCFGGILRTGRGICELSFPLLFLVSTLAAPQLWQFVDNLLRNVYILDIICTHTSRLEWDNK